MPSVTPHELLNRLQKSGSTHLIDVRSGSEFADVHVAGAELHPLHKLDPETVRTTRPSDAEGPVLVLCRSGQRSAKAAAQLNEAGVDAVVVEGGTMACVEAGLPVVRGKSGMSMERQVRVAAGGLVAAGTALGWFVHPLFFLLPAFVGCGLVFSGLTDTCGMGAVLARMPWNNSKATCAVPASGRSAS